MVSMGAQFTFNGERYKVVNQEGHYVFASKVGKRGRPSKFTLVTVEQLIRDTGTTLAEVFETENQVGPAGAVLPVTEVTTEAQPVSTPTSETLELRTEEIPF